MGAYGAANSVYSNFIARGRDVVFPKNTVVEIALAKRSQANEQEYNVLESRGKL
jgi:hypothetical protein